MKIDSVTYKRKGKDIKEERKKCKEESRTKLTINSVIMFIFLPSNIYILN